MLCANEAAEQARTNSDNRNMHFTLIEVQGASPVSLNLSRRPAHEVENQRDHCKCQQNVNGSARNVHAEPEDDPQHQQYEEQAYPHS